VPFRGFSFHARTTEAPGALQGVTFVQRLNTQGGAAPATGCESTSVGSEVKVPYSATYLFLRQH
jgi:hypothetical protein